MSTSSKVLSILGRGGLSIALAASMSAFGAVSAFGASSAGATESYWETPSSAVSTGSSLVKTYGVRAGSAGADYLGISNTNFDFTSGTNTAGYTGYDSITDMGASYLTTVSGSGLAIWATSVNENPNPYYANLYYTIVNGTYSTAGAAGLNAATTWMSNPSSSSWGDSDNSESVAADGEPTIAGLEYEPEIIFGANKTTNWNLESDGSNSNTNIYTYESTDDSYNPVYVTNDATNLWTQVYTMGQLATAADEITSSSSLSTRYDDSDATESALSYEKATRGQLLYIASLIDTGQLESKTIAYLYAIDADGTGYFFVPEAEGLTSDTTTGDGTGTGGSSANSSTSTNQSYAANNSTINMGYMATLPYISTTFDSGTELAGGIVMAVENLYSENPVCTVSDSSSSSVMKDVDIIIYNTTTYTSDMSGTSNGRNSSGITNDYNGDALSADEVEEWAAQYGFTGSTIAGDDYGTSTKQGYGTASATADGMSPLLYCQRNYTSDKDTRAAWGFAAVYPEAYENNNDATYAYWVDNVYHVNTSDVSTVVQYMTNQSSSVVYGASTAQMVEDCAEIGYDWWFSTGIDSDEWSAFAYYNGASRASYFSGEADTEEPTDTIGIFAPSSLWVAAMEDEDDEEEGDIEIYSENVSLSATSFAYTGKAKTPAVTVKVNGEKLVKGSDYTVTYASGRKAIGTYKVTVKGMGDYYGTVTKTFKIVPGKVTLKSVKAGKKGSKKLTAKWKKLSGGVSYQIAYKKGNGKWKYTKVSSKTAKKVLKKLKKGKKYTVKVRAYKKVSGTTYYGSWSKSKTVKVK